MSDIARSAMRKVDGRAAKRCRGIAEALAAVLDGKIVQARWVPGGNVFVVTANGYEYRIIVTDGETKV